jgi:hypothetical protein
VIEALDDGVFGHQFGVLAGGSEIDEAGTGEMARRRRHRQADR